MLEVRTVINENIKERKEALPRSVTWRKIILLGLDKAEQVVKDHIEVHRIKDLSDHFKEMPDSTKTDNDFIKLTKED